MTNQNTSETGKNSSRRVRITDILPSGCLKQELLDAFVRVMESGRYILGPEVDAFEQELAAYGPGLHAVGVASGTDALELALRASAGEGQCVVTVGNSAPATAIAIVRAGFQPIYAEVGREGLMCPVDLEHLLMDQSDVAAIVPVDLYGQPSMTLHLAQIAKKYRVPVVVDAAQSFGSGSFCRGAHAVATSFYPTKMLGALGDGGAVITTDRGVADRVRDMRFYGMSAPKTHKQDRNFGINSRLDELQAALLRVKLKYWKDERDARRFIVERYLQLIPHELIRRNGDQNWHLFTIHCSNRDFVRLQLDQAGVDTAIHYPIPAWNQPMTQGMTHHCTMKSTLEFMKTTLTIPCHGGMSMRDVDLVAGVIARTAQP